MAKKSLVGKPVRVIWDDAWQAETYYDDLEIAVEVPKVLHSYGLCIRNDKVGVALAMDDLRPNGDQRYRDVKFIPRGMVRKVKILK